MKIGLIIKFLINVNILVRFKIGNIGLAKTIQLVALYF